MVPNNTIKSSEMAGGAGGEFKDFQISNLFPETPCFDAAEGQIRGISLSVSVFYAPSLSRSEYSTGYYTVRAVCS